MPKKPFPFKVCEECCSTGGGGGTGGDVDLSNYLSKDNEEEYTPTSPYNPSTKKYVDDAVEGSKYKGGSTDTVDVDVNYTGVTKTDYDVSGKIAITIDVDSGDTRIELNGKDSVSISVVIVNYSDGLSEEIINFDGSVDLAQYNDVASLTVVLGNGVNPTKSGEIEVTTYSSKPNISANLRDGSVRPEHLANNTVPFYNDGNILYVSNGRTYVAQEPISWLSITYPDTDFLCSLHFTTSDDDNILIMLPLSSKYIGEVPTFGKGETWELSIKNGVVVGGKVV